MPPTRSELDEELASLEGMKKPPTALRLAVSSVGALLGLSAAGDGDSFNATVSELTDYGGEVADRVSELDPASVSVAAADAVFGLMQHAEWDVDRVREHGWPAMADLAERVVDVYQALSSLDGRKPILAPNFVVAADGSRMSYLALDVAVQMRGHGRLNVLHVTDPSKDYLPPQLYPDYLRNDFWARLTHKAVPQTHFEVTVTEKREGEKTRTVVEREVYEHSADVLVLGAFGRKGPSIFAIGSTTDYCVRSLPCTTVVVKPASVVLRAHQSALFVVAVDHSETARAAFRTALGLMQPGDAIHVVHIRVENPQDPEDTASDDLVDTYEQMVDMSMMRGEAQLLEKEQGKTVAQQICDLVERRRATYLVLGIDGMGNYLRGEEWIGSVADACVRVARCTTVLTKRSTYFTS